MADEKKQKKVNVADIMGGEKSEKSEKSEKKSDSGSKSDKGKATPKRKHKHTHIEHHYNEEGEEAGHTVRHSGDGEEVSYAAPDMDAVHDGLEKHVGGPNGDEGEQQMPPQAGAPAAGGQVA